MTFSDIATSTSAGISTMVGDLFTLIGDNIGVVLTILSVSIGIPFLIKFVRRLAK
ncbi:MAG: hypothetical protein PHS54_06250 [Clostridia bacterium]|nr:hypothetical protein [Clostridia bacterium]